MSTYATLDNLKDRLGSKVYAQITDREGMIAPNDTIGAVILDDAEAWINGELANRYHVPIPVAADVTLADLMRMHTLTAATFFAYADHPTLRADIPDGVKDKFKLTKAWLKSVAAGVDLPGGPSTSTGGGITAKRGGADRVFGTGIY